MSQLSGSLVPSMGGLTPKAEFLLLPREVSLQEGVKRRFTDGELAGLVTFFKSLRRSLVIDYEHQTMATLKGFENFASPDGTAPAAGWVGDVAVRPDGLWAQRVTWTPKASKMLASGEYKFYSPVVFWDGVAWAAGSSPKALGPVGLTNDPDLNGLEPCAARATHDQLLSLNQESDMDLKKLIAELMGLDANAPEDDFTGACKAWCGKAKESLAKMATMSASVSKADHESTISGLKTAHEGAIAAMKSGHEQAVSAIKMAHDQALASANAAHSAEVTALKSSHTGALATLTEQLATAIVDGLEVAGKISGKDRDGQISAAKANPQAVIEAFKPVRIGAVVPVQQLLIKQAGAAASVAISPHDSVSTSRAFHSAPEDRQALHRMAVQIADAKKISYEEAVAQAMAQLNSAG